MTDNTPETIVCFSSQRWRDRMWTNKQHIMSRLAKDHRVVHVDYGLRPLPQYLAERAYFHPGQLWPPQRLFYDGVVQEDENLLLGDSYSPFWTGLFPLDHPVRDFFTFDAKVLMVKRYLKREAIDPIVWVYHPGFADAVEKMERKLLVYDCVDNYEAFPHYEKQAGWLKARDEKLCRMADVVFCTSQEIYEQRRPFNPENTYLVHNVGDADHFKQAMDPALEVPEELRALKGPIIGFYGAVRDYKVNLDWIRFAAEKRPDWNFVLIGPSNVADLTTCVRELRALPNVHILGHRPYEMLPAYIKGFDVAVIPYRINDYTRSVFPIKFFEYLATGKPVVISNLPALEEFYDTVGVACDEAEFVEWCEAMLEDDDPQMRARRIQLAEEHSWPKRISELMKRVNERL